MLSQHTVRTAALRDEAQRYLDVSLQVFLLDAGYADLFYNVKFWPRRSGRLDFRLLPRGPP